MLEEIKRRLDELSTPKIQEFSKKLIPNSLPILGCKIPDLRKLAKEIVRKDYKTFFKEYDASTYELQLVYAYTLASAKLEIKERIRILRGFIPTIRDWAVCDGLVSSLKCTKAYPEEMLAFILEYIESHQEFEVRFLAEMLMVYYLTPQYVCRAVQIVLNLDITHYYAKMGVAWFIASLMIDYQDLAFQLLKEIEDLQTVAMAIRKIRDSYRVPMEIKEKVLFYKK